MSAVSADSPAADGSANQMAIGADIDGDGIADVDDSCPTRAEDADGEADFDGCPETDLSMTVEKDDSLIVTDGEASLFTVTTTATNGNYGLTNPDAMTFLELLKSNVTNPNDGCQALWIPQPGDQGINDLIWEDWAYTGYTDSNGNTIPDEGEPGVELVLHSFLQATFTDVPAFGVAINVRQYEVQCNTSGARQILLEEGVIPTYPISDPDVQNNVHKQYIDIAVEPAVTPTPCPDSDGDGFDDCVESNLGTSPLSACAGTGTSDGMDNDGDTLVDEAGEGANDENPDPLPPDADDDQDSDVGDLIALFLGKIFNPPAYDPRSDFDGDTDIDVGDIINGFLGRMMTSCA